jgi:polyisoprenyl-phosphate glycosyltransferase
MTIVEAAPIESIAIDLVIPVFNEIDCLDELVRRVGDVRSQSDGLHMSLILVDDGSHDGSSERLTSLSEQHDWVSTVHLVRNFGHQAAVTAGLDASTAEYVAVIDADLQDPPELIPEMLAKLRSQNLNVVYGTREERPGDSWFKRKTATGFYKLLRLLSGLDIPLDTGDFRVMDRPVVEALRSLPEHNRLMRALIPWLGYRSDGLLYKRDERFAGTTKYPLRKMVMLATHAVFSFSTFPIRAVQGFGLFMCLLGAVGISCLGVLDLSGTWDAGIGPWLTVGIVSQTGVLLLAMGVIGGYVFRIQDEVKGRPVYVRSGTELGDRRAPGDRRVTGEDRRAKKTKEGTT